MTAADPLPTTATVAPAEADRTHILNLSCTDRPGIVARVTTSIAAIGGNIAESAQYWDRSTDRFFMRILFTAPAEVGHGVIHGALKSAIDGFGMTFSLTDGDTVPRILILVSKFDHCLLNLLYQIRVGWLRAEVAAIASNHPDARAIAEQHGVPFHHFPVTKATKPEQEAQVLRLYRDTGADLVVLARYMQVLSNELSTALSGHAINIHHSFLPSFKGAKPYHQAHERGVKLIGATAHYVTPDLDEGPIIEQETERVTHALSADDLVAVGRDVEARVLARGVKLHLERRVLLNGHKTVVF
ncbi:formyltetrahydrofolate deformylase [Lichenibacterium minor]|jgi:formyltetrahydrofolate deformylase|uniref:Formyltetrahydrofolate deformylase n=1 Tax=Lichenibacterium minor TaxID=2316528 RepID=A0A4Q2UAK2_9HYPH|nr:formyltetrahydrofolate deformylase [Lichenibacterium minor]RYC32147.1 formyltetrahydrofolate deformylase [Lichenibacterium minor]